MTDAEAETPILWPPDVKSQLTGKDPDAGKDRGQEKGTTCCSPQVTKCQTQLKKHPQAVPSPPLGAQVYHWQSM